MDYEERGARGSRAAADAAKVTDREGGVNIFVQRFKHSGIWYNRPMSEEIITIEESEAKVLNPHDPSGRLCIQVERSPKTERIRDAGPVIYKGERYVVSKKMETGDAGGGPEQLFLLPVEKQAGDAAERASPFPVQPPLRFRG